MVIKASNGKCNDADSSIKGSNPGAGKLITRGRVAGVNRRRGTRIVAGFCLPRDHGVRFPDRAPFVTRSFQHSLAFRPRLLWLPRCRLMRRCSGVVRSPRHLSGLPQMAGISDSTSRADAAASAAPPAEQSPPIRKSESQPRGTPTTSPTDSSCQSSQLRHRFYRLERPNMCRIRCHGACWITFVAPLLPSER